MEWQAGDDAGKGARFGALTFATETDQSSGQLEHQQQQQQQQQQQTGCNPSSLSFRPSTQRQPDAMQSPDRFQNRSPPRSPGACFRDDKLGSCSLVSSPETASTWRTGFRLASAGASLSQVTTPDASELPSPLATPAASSPERFEGDRTDIVESLRASNNMQQIAMLQNEVMGMKDLIAQMHVSQGQLALQMKQHEQSTSSRITDVEVLLQDADVPAMKNVLNQLGSKTEKALADLLRHMDEQWQASKGRDVLVEERLALLEGLNRPQVVPPLPDLQLIAQIQRLEEDLSVRVDSLEKAAPTDANSRLQQLEETQGRRFEQDAARVQQWEESVSARFRNLEQAVDQAMTQTERLQQDVEARLQEADLVGMKSLLSQLNARGYDADIAGLKNMMHQLSAMVPDADTIGMKSMLNELSARVQDTDVVGMKSMLNQLRANTEEALTGLARRLDEQWHSSQSRESMGREVRERLVELERSLVTQTAEWQNADKQLATQLQLRDEALCAAGDHRVEVLTRVQQLEDSLFSRIQAQDSRLQAKLQDVDGAMNRNLQRLESSLLSVERQVVSLPTSPSQQDFGQAASLPTSPTPQDRRPESGSLAECTTCGHTWVRRSASPSSGQCVVCRHSPPRSSSRARSARNDSNAARTMSMDKLRQELASPPPMQAAADLAPRQRICQCGKELFGDMDACFRCRAKQLATQQEERSRWITESTVYGGGQDCEPDRYRANFC